MTVPVKKKMQPSENLAYRIIDTPVELRAIAQKLSAEPMVAVDLEADSLHHYREKVCLIQIATQSDLMVIDPLQIGDLSPIRTIFSNPRIQKVFHGADYDVRSLSRDFNFTIRNLFDTELASRFLGSRESGLDSVLLRWFGVKLDKKYQKKDWSVRPLPEKMIEYAIKDVYYLVPLAKALQKELTALGRDRWVLEECIRLSKVRSARSNGEPLFLRFKGAGRLDPRSLAVLEGLLQLRDRIAAGKDRPAFKVFGSESITKMVLLKTSDVASLKEHRILSRRQIDMHGAAVADAIHHALQMPADRLPRYPRTHPPDVAAGVRRRVRALRAWRDKKADALDLDPAIVCSKSLMAAIAQKNPRSPEELESVRELKHWQRKTYGKEILQVLGRTRGAKPSA